MAKVGTQEAISKSVITSGSFGGGIGLSWEESDRFLDYVIDQSMLKNNVRIEKMTKATKKIDKVGIGENILIPATAGVDPGNTVGISTGQIVLQAKEMIAIVEVSDDSLEDNIEGDAFVDHLMRMVSAQVANELEGAFLMGKQIQNVGDATHINQLFDGWATRAKNESNVLDATTYADRHISRDKLSRMMKAMPLKYRKNRTNLRYLMADDIYQDYNDLMADRMTPGGDGYVQTLAPALGYGNVKFDSISLLPTDMAVPKTGGAVTTVATGTVAGALAITVAEATGITAGATIQLGKGTAFEEVITVSSVNTNTLTLTTPMMFKHAVGEHAIECTEDGSFSMLTDYRNLICGMHRDIRIETERWARKRSTAFVLTLRADIQIENPEAIVYMDNLQVK